MCLIFFKMPCFFKFLIFAFIKKKLYNMPLTISFISKEEMSIAFSNALINGNLINDDDTARYNSKRGFQIIKDREVKENVYRFWS